MLLRRTIVDAADNDNLLTEDNVLQTNAYPSSNPVLSDDGQLLVYISDSNSSNMADKVVSYSMADASGKFAEGTPIPGGFRSYGDSEPDLDGDKDFAAAAWIRLLEDPNGTEGKLITESDINKILNAQEIVVSVWNGNNWSTERITEDNLQDTMPVIAVDKNSKTTVVVWCAGSQAFDESGVTDPAAQDRILVLGLDEIPDSGVPVYFRVTAVIEEDAVDTDGTTYTQFIEQYEAGTANNQQMIIFDSLLARSNDAPTTITTTQSINAEGNTPQPSKYRTTPSPNSPTAIWSSACSTAKAMCWKPSSRQLKTAVPLPLVPKAQQTVSSTLQNRAQRSLSVTAKPIRTRWTQLFPQSLSAAALSR